MITAVIAYLREIRDKRGLSQEALAQATGLSLRQVNRWENGGSDMLKADTLMKAVEFLGASLEQTKFLIIHSDLSADEGRRRAHEWLNSGNIDKLPDPVQRLAQSLDLAHMNRWIGYGERLLEEQQKGGCDATNQQRSPAS